MRESTRRKRLELVILIMIVLGLTVFTPTGVNANDRQGIELSIGGLSNQAMGAHDSNYDFNWARIGVFNNRDIDGNWDIDALANLGYMWWTAKDPDNPDANAVNIGIEGILYRKVYKSLSLGLGIGIGTVTPSNDLPELGSSGVYGTITGRLRLKLSNNFGVVVGAEHISDIFQEDGGKNVFPFKVYYVR